MELIGVDEKLLNDVKFLMKVFKKAAKEANAKIIKTIYHKFKPYGITLAVLVKESHLTIHTYPEFKYAACDVFTCGKTNAEKAAEYIIKELKPKKVKRKVLIRGF